MRFHADDLGASQSITEAVLDCYQCGAIESTSVLVTRLSLETLAEQLKPYPKLELALHLNLTDGRPLTDTSHLCDENGYFCNSFLSLAWLYLVSSSEKRQQIRTEIAAEFLAQTEVFMELLELLGRPAELRVDSHEHVHLLPFVFPQLEALQAHFSIKRIRLPLKIVYLAHYGSPLTRHIQGATLTWLSRYLRSRCSIPFEAPEVLLTGKINPGKLGAQARNSEVIFHPGVLGSVETRAWQGDARSRAAYSAEHRGEEHRELMEYAASNTDIGSRKAFEV